MFAIKTILSVALVCWSVYANPVRVIDGDTFVADLQIWHKLTIRERVRVLNVDTPEKSDKTKWLQAKNFTEQWLAGDGLQLHTCKMDSFGRILATVSRGDGSDLASELIKAGLGTDR